MSFYGTGFVNSSDLEIRFGAHEPGGPNFARVNMTGPGLAKWDMPRLWDVKFVSDVKISTTNPYHGQTSRVDVVVTSNKQQYFRSDHVYYYSSSSAAMTVVTNARRGAVAGQLATFRIEAREANGAAKIEGGDQFVVSLSHTHPNYQAPLCRIKSICPFILRSPWDISIVNPFGNGPSAPSAQPSANETPSAPQPVPRALFNNHATRVKHGPRDRRGQSTL